MEKTLRNGGVRVLGDADFNQRGLPSMNTNKPILVALLSESCGWCHKTVPELVKASKNSNVVCAAVIVGSSPIGERMMRAAKTSGVPSFLLFYGGKLIDKASGAKSQQDILKFARVQ
jgi:thiol-disulfide isomerase/thioredoxin